MLREILIKLKQSPSIHFDGPPEPSELDAWALKTTLDTLREKIECLTGIPGLTLSIKLCIQSIDNVEFNADARAIFVAALVVKERVDFLAAEIGAITRFLRGLFPNTESEPDQPDKLRTIYISIPKHILSSPASFKSLAGELELIFSRVPLILGEPPVSEVHFDIGSDYICLLLSQSAFYLWSRMVTLVEDRRKTRDEANARRSLLAELYDPNKDKMHLTAGLARIEERREAVEEKYFEALIQEYESNIEEGNLSQARKLMSDAIDDIDGWRENQISTYLSLQTPESERRMVPSGFGGIGTEIVRQLPAIIKALPSSSTNE